MRILGIHGKARSGKDTSADIIMQRYNAVKYSFAAPIKAAFESIFGFHPDDLPPARKEENIPGFNFSPRTALQTLGTEWGRALNPDIWLNLADKAATDCKLASLNQRDYFIIPDVRFDNEAKWIKEKGGILLEVYRDDRPDVAVHSSEAGISVVPDYVISNNGNFNDLEDRLAVALQLAEFDAE